MQAEKLIHKRLQGNLSDHAYLLVSSDSKILDQQIIFFIQNLDISKHQVIRIAATDKKNGEIGIQLVRELRRQLSLKTTEGYRLVIIEQAEKLTTEAANSFLKTLEEPPEKTIIILTASSQNLLPTIVSRCQLYIFPVKSEYKLISQSEIGDLTKMSIKEKFALAEKISKETDINLYLQDLSVYYSKLLIKSHKYSSILKRLETAKKHFSAGVNPRIILENIFLNLV